MEVVRDVLIVSNGLIQEVVVINMTDIVQRALNGTFHKILVQLLSIKIQRKFKYEMQ